MVKAIVGEAPWLPWWKALYMSDEEIKEYNRKYLKEVDLEIDHTSTLQIALNKVYNQGIEDAARWLETTDKNNAAEIRKLKRSVGK